MLSTSVERLEDSNAKLSVTVSADEVDAAIERAYKNIGQRYRVPGFRPGKVPRPIIDQTFGKENILADATEDLVQTVYPKALDAEMLRPIESPEIEDLETVQAGEEYSFVADVTLRPELTLTSVKEFSVTLPPKDATEGDVERSLAAAREQYATLEPVEGRAVESGDFVLLSFVGTVDGEPYDGNVVDQYLYESAKGLLPVEFDEGITGMNPGDERHFEFTINDTGANPDFAGKLAGFDVTVHEIKSKLLPEIDEEFAANMGFESVEAMRTDLKQRLGLQRATAFDREKERALREELASLLVGEVPEVMVAERRESLKRDFSAMLEAREWTLEYYLQFYGLELLQFEKDMELQAAELVKEDLALESLFRSVGLEITDEDLDEEISEISKASETTPEEARKRWAEMGLMPVIHEQIMHRKAVYWLMDNAVVIEKDPDEEADAPAKAAPKKKAAAKKKAEAPSADAAESTEE